MNILLTGASGLIGSHCLRALRCAGHRVTATMRGSPAIGDNSWIRADYTRDVHIDNWIPRLDGVEVVINTVGIAAERNGQTFEALHWLAPRALFAACATAGVKRVIQLSALGADENASTQFHLTKKAADDFLLGLPIEAVVLQPSLVFSEDGQSTQLFALFAAAPLLAMPAGEQLIQPVALEELVETIVKLVDKDQPPRRLAVVGGAAVTFRTYLQLLRKRMGYANTLVVSIPLAVLRVLLRIPGVGRVANVDSLAMLERGNHADAAPLGRLLGRMPAAPQEFITASRAKSLRRATTLHANQRLLRFAIALMWIATGVFSLGIYPIEDSMELLRRTGLTGFPARLALFGAAGLDIVLGMATLCCRYRWIWSAQMLLIITYTVIISIKLPEFWLHPYGPVLKNIPLLAAIALMRNWERR